ncbi:MAG: YncE family protein [Bacteroidales bacterium]|nr:YncE family protein [Bacteroidales bacterium]
MKLKHYFLILVVIGFFSCQDETVMVDPPPFGSLGKGFFIINQGNFTLANASLSFFNTDSAKMTNHIFYKVNNVPLGDVAQSMVLWENYGFIVVNNSGIIYVIDKNDASYVGKITGLQSPRFMCFIHQGKAYVSDIQRPEIAVVDPISFNITDKIYTGKSVENMVFVNNKVFACNWSDYYTTKPNNTIQVIDPEVDRVIDSIVVVKEPNSMVVDSEGFLWVLCSGGYMNEEIPALLRINTTSHEIQKKFIFPDIAFSPNQLTVNLTGDTLYFINQDIYRLSIQDSQLPLLPLIESENRTFYALAIDPSNNQIVVSDAKNYVQDGYIYRFQSNGTLIDSIKSGVIPGQIVFN